MRAIEARTRSCAVCCRRPTTGFDEHAAGGAAQDRLGDPGTRRRRRLRADLRVLPRQVRDGGGPEGRRVLHADLHRPADRRDHRAVPRPHLRPRLRLRRHVRPVRQVRRASTRDGPERRARRSTGRRRSPRPCGSPMNLAVHGLAGRHPRGQQLLRGPPRTRRPVRLRHGQSAVQRQRVDKDASSTADRRFPFGLPSADNGNYLWIQLFYAALNDTGRAGFVMANSAGDARGSELEIRRKLIEDRARRRDGRHRAELLLHRHAAVHALVPRQRARRRRREDTGAVHRRPPHLPPDRPRPPRLPARADRVPRQHRAPLPRRSDLDYGRRRRDTAQSRSSSATGAYADVPGLCKVATLAEIDAQG